MTINLDIAHYIAVGVSAVVVGLLAVFYKQVTSAIVWLLHRLGVRFKRSFGYHVNCPGDAVAKALQDIRAQLQSNGGTSIRDAVMRTEQRVMGLSREVRHLRVTHDLFTESMNFPAFRADADGKTVWMNRVLKLIAGITDDNDALGMAWLSLVHPDDRDKVRDHWLKAVEERREYSDKYRVVTRPYGKVITIASLAKPIRTEGTLTGWSGTFRILDSKTDQSTSWGSYLNVCADLAERGEFEEEGPVTR